MRLQAAGSGQNAASVHPIHVLSYPLVVWLQAAGSGQSAASVQRSLAAVDPRAQHNALGHMPYQVAQRVGFVTLGMVGGVS